MKLKSLLLLVSSISLLASCGKSSAPAIDNTDSNITSDTNTGSEDTGSQDTGSSDTGSTDTNPGTDTDTGTDTGDTSPVEEDKVYTTPANFASAFTAGYQFDITEGSQDLLKSAMDPQGKIIKSIETKVVTVQEHIQESGDKNVELTIGTGKSDGKLTFNTSSPLKAISFELQSYSKYVSYSSSYSRDAAPTVTINSYESKTLTPATEGENPIEEYAVTFSEPTSKVVISNDAGAHRVFIKSVTFTF